MTTNKAKPLLSCSKPLPWASPLLAGNTTSSSSAGRPSSFLVRSQEPHPDNHEANKLQVIYFFFPETARLTLEEIAKNFGEEVAVNLTDATDEEKAQLDRKLVENGGASPPSYESQNPPKAGEDTVQPAPVDEPAALPKQ